MYKFYVILKNLLTLSQLLLVAGCWLLMLQGCQMFAGIGQDDVLLRRGLKGQSYFVILCSNQLGTRPVLLFHTLRRLLKGCFVSNVAVASYERSDIRLNRPNPPQHVLMVTSPQASPSPLGSGLVPETLRRVLFFKQLQSSDTFFSPFISHILLVVEV